MAFKLTFWGTRGSIACAMPSHVKYGGNTSCLEFNLGDRTLVFDAGTGIRQLGQELMKREVKDITLLLTHTHWDHINGFPFFVPAYVPGNTIRVMAGHLSEAGGVQTVLSTQMANPMFPVPLETMQADMRFEDFVAGASLDLGDGIEIATAPLNHPNGATGYRITYEGRSVCYVTDTEHVIGQPDQNVLNLIQGADLVIYDCTYTDDEFPAKIGWGHSTWQEGVRLCQAAGVEKLAIFHHEPDHDDVFMEQLEAEAAAAWDRTFVARDGMSITLPPPSA